MPVKILIAEDKKLLAQDLEDRITTLKLGKVIGSFAYGEEAIDFARRSLPDLAILDISLKGDMDGITLAEKLNEKRYIPVIYLTHLDDEATLSRTLPTVPVAYLNKPFTNNELKIAVLNASKALKTEQQEEKLPSQEPSLLTDGMQILEDRVFVRNGRGKHSVSLADIVYIQSGGGEKSTIITSQYLDQKSGSRPSVGYSLSKLEPKLSFYPFLVRCSRFYMVNLKHVERIIDVDSDHKNKGKKTLVVRGEEIKVGDKYRKEILARLHVL